MSIETRIFYKKVIYMAFILIFPILVEPVAAKQQESVADPFYKNFEHHFPWLAAFPLVKITASTIDAAYNYPGSLDLVLPAALVSAWGGQNTAILSGIADEQPAAVDVAQMKTGVFGSVAIPFSKLKALQRWKDIIAAVDRADFDHCFSLPDCGPADLTIVRGIDVARALDLPEKLQLINTTINNAVAYRSDRQIYGRTDYWAQPAEMIAREEGDCEDFAILKMAALHSAGVPTKSMSLVVLRDRKRNFFHAVLSVSTTEGDFILDILSDTVLRDSAFADYQPLYSLSDMRAWLHGYRRSDDKLASDNSDLQEVAPGTGLDRVSAGSIQRERPRHANRHHHPLTMKPSSVVSSRVGASSTFRVPRTRRSSEPSTIPVFTG